MDSASGRRWPGSIETDKATMNTLLRDIKEAIVGSEQDFTSGSLRRAVFLLAIPIIGAAGSYGALRVIMGDANIDWIAFVLAMAFSAAAGWVCIAAFLALLKRVGLMPFVIYRLVLGLVLLWIVW